MWVASTPSPLPTEDPAIVSPLPGLLPLPTATWQPLPPTDGPGAARAVAIATLTDVVIGLLIAVIFLALRKSKPLQWIYSARLLQAGQGHPARSRYGTIGTIDTVSTIGSVGTIGSIGSVGTVDAVGSSEQSRDDGTTERVLPPASPPTWWSWIPALLSVSIEDVTKTCGFDATLFLVFQSWCMRLFATCSVVLLPLLLLNLSGREGRDVLEHMSITNLSNGSELLWFHVLACYTTTLIVMRFMFTFYQRYVVLHRAYLHRSDPNQYAAMFLDVYPPLRQDRGQKLTDYLRCLFPEDRYLSVQMAQDRSRMFSLHARRTALNARLMSPSISGQRAGVSDMGLVRWLQFKAYCAIHGSSSTLMSSPLSSVETDASTTAATASTDPSAINGSLASELRYQIWMIEKELEDIRADSLQRVNVLPTAFVYFDRRRSWQEALSLPLDDMPIAQSIVAAPGEDEVLWSSISMSSRQRTVRRWCADTFVLALVLFWSIPISFVASLTTLKNAIRYLPFLSVFLTKFRILNDWLEVFLPTVTFSIFLLFLPLILYRCATCRGEPSKSMLERRVLHYFFLFCFINFFLVSAIAGSLFDVLLEVIDRPGRLPALLGSSIPRYSSFFLSFILLRTLVTVPLDLIRLDLLLYDVLLRICCFAAERRHKLRQPGEMGYGTVFPLGMLIFILALTYSVVSPLLLSAATAYFAIAYLSAKYQLLYVCTPMFESGGAFWPSMFNRLCFGLGLSQLTLIGLMGLKARPWLALALVPLPLLTVWYIAWMHKRFALADMLPLRHIVEEDGGESVDVPGRRRWTEDGGWRGGSQRRYLDGRGSDSEDGSLSHRRGILHPLYSSSSSSDETDWLDPVGATCRGPSAREPRSPPSIDTEPVDTAVDGNDLPRIPTTPSPSIDNMRRMANDLSTLDDNSTSTVHTPVMNAASASASTSASAASLLDGVGLGMIPPSPDHHITFSAFD